MNFENKRILVVSSKFHPDNSPRAHRTHQLVMKFVKKDFEVDLFVPEYISNHEKYKTPMLKYFHPTKINILNENSLNQPLYHSTNKFLKLKKIMRYLVGGDPRSLLYGYKLYKKMNNTPAVKTNEYVGVISIGLPFYVHLATALWMKKNKKKTISIADYGDPFYNNPQMKKFIFLKFVEKLTLKKFNYITIPTEESRKYYLDLVPEEKIKIIPQGFNFDEVKINIKSYHKNEIPTFCYAGIFYEKLRNPEYFFEFLTKLNFQFKFVIYTRVNDVFFNEVYAKYKELLKDKVEIRGFIKRKELIVEMSKMDFLINIENEGTSQSPSKLIDYALSNRPIYSFTSQTINFDTFKDFCFGNYNGEKKIDLDQYDINVVYKKVLNLLEEKS